MRIRVADDHDSSLICKTQTNDLTSGVILRCLHHSRTIAVLDPARRGNETQAAQGSRHVSDESLTLR